ncbi:MAG: hypothetical protein DI626_00170 [Micavibrio aeruginosavorus]|uniref:Uncharacterized protein n=1 Tax=Micavibrio aeruginosavorus TaxID=349221 RepID=A0A2W5A3G6_9BACT|nr:MAG: hypothetical protein DI626_00170 [Micavibrio aeruginosavorus]
MFPFCSFYICPVTSASGKRIFVKTIRVILFLAGKGEIMIRENQAVGESRFNMWRAVVSMIHVDGVVTPHEVNCIIEFTRDIPFSDEQRRIIDADISSPQMVKDLFAAISSPRDREYFFHLARAVSWSDGDLDEKEEALLRELGVIGQEGDVLLVANRSFDEIYIEGRQANQDDLNIGKLIRRLMGKKTA